MERLPSISEDQPLIMPSLYQDMAYSSRQARSSVADISLSFQAPSPPPQSSNNCLSLPANITDLSALLSQLKLNSPSSCFEQKVDAPPKFSRSMSEPYHQPVDLLSPNAFSNPKINSSIFDLQALNGSSSSNNNNNSNSNTTGNNNSSSTCCRYKTELCRPFEENGSCKYGEKCQFAHGKHELRSLARHPKYKTDLCKTYHTTGLCPYGPRCHFIHNDEERHLNLINRLVLEHQRQQILVEQQNNKLIRQKQLLLAAAISSQKQFNSHPAMLARHMSVDSSAEQLSALLNLQSTLSSLQSNQIPAQQCWPNSQPSLYQQIRQMSCGGSSGDSPSSSITESPSPSPTSIEEPVTSKNLPAFQTVLETLLKFNSRASVMN